MTQLAFARVYLALQALAGAVWWVAVFASDLVRIWTLGSWDPRWLVVPDLLLFVGGSAVAAGRSSWQIAAATTTWTGALSLALAGYGLAERAAGWGVLLMTAATVGSLAATLTLRSGRMPTGWFFVGPFSFRPAAERSRRRHVASSVFQLVLFWVGFFVLMPVLLRIVETRLRVQWDALTVAPWPVLGGVLFLLASPLGLASCLVMARRGEGTPLPSQTARKLVVAGAYRWVRNPMATAGVLQSVGMGLWFGSWTMVVAAFGGALAWHVGIRPVEEADLLARFGEPYQRYRAGVRCWVPRFASQPRAITPRQRGA